MTFTVDFLISRFQFHVTGLKVTGLMLCISCLAPKITLMDYERKKTNIVWVLRNALFRIQQINVRENHRRGNQEWTIQEKYQHWLRQTKQQKHNTEN